MGSNSQELSLDFNRAYIPETITSFLRELSKIRDDSDRLSRLNEYVKRLEDEMRKIDAFKRELPLCMLLVNDAINALKEQMQCTAPDVRPVLEEFIPLKRISEEDGDVNKEKDCKDKKNWMSSFQLWSTNGDLNYDRKQKSVADVKEGPEEDDRCASGTEKSFQLCRYNNSEGGDAGGGAFMPFKGYSGFPATTRNEKKVGTLPISGLSLVYPVLKSSATEASSGLNSKGSIASSSINVQSNSQKTMTTNSLQQQEQQTTRKQRRCWSPELHRRFVNALQQLGGSKAATPKQIRELMKVDGLTNDEVKSHLQKYRLHTRRSPATATQDNQTVVVLGDLWMSQDQYGATTKPSTSQSGSPQGPLQLSGTVGGVSTTGGESVEDDEDGKSESFSWKGHLQKSGEDNV